MSYIIDDKRGWFGLYNSRLIGGGLRFRQKRVKLNDENDNHNYGPGWTTLDDNVKTNDTINTPWIYSRQSSHFGIPLQFRYFYSYLKNVLKLIDDIPV